jgi:hypothetical protein
VQGGVWISVRVGIEYGKRALRGHKMRRALATTTSRLGWDAIQKKNKPPKWARAKDKRQPMSREEEELEQVNKMNRKHKPKEVVRQVDGAPIRMRSVGSYKDYAENKEMASKAIERFHALSPDAQAAIIASMETENEPAMVALNTICDMTEEEMNNLDPEEMDKLFKTAGIDPKLMFGAEERVDEECERIAEEIALEILDLRNFLPPASRWRAKEKGLLSQVHQVEKFLIQSYVDDEEDAKLILQKIHEVEKLPKEEQRQAIQSRKQNLLKEKEKEMNSKMEEKERKLRLYLPQGKKRLIDLNDDILS